MLVMQMQFFLQRWHFAHKQLDQKTAASLLPIPFVSTVRYSEVKEVDFGGIIFVHNEKGKHFQAFVSILHTVWLG